MSLPDTSASSQPLSERWIAFALLSVAGLGWWWSISAAGGMDRDMAMGAAGEMGSSAMSLAAFLVAWVAMMAAMMLPAVLPVVRLYARAAGRATVAPLAVFLAGYAAIWSSMGLPVFVLWRRLEGPLADGSTAAGRLAGAVLLASAAYQLSPLKAACLRHCRSPLSLFMQHGHDLRRPTGAFVTGARHGLYCLGCCWMLMAVLVVLGTMELRWMAVIAAVIVLEKVTPFGERVALAASLAFLPVGALLLFDPQTISSLT